MLSVFYRVGQFFPLRVDLVRNVRKVMAQRRRGGDALLWGAVAAETLEAPAFGMGQWSASAVPSSSEGGIIITGLRLRALKLSSGGVANLLVEKAF